MLFHKFKLTGLKIIPAELKHSKCILDMLSPYFDSIILQRDEEDIKSHIHNFIIAEYGGVPVGCVAVRDFSNGLFEIRSLAVKPEAAGKGIGSALIAFAVDWVQGCRNGKRVFALTLRPKVFTLVGFKLVVKELFPEKVWHDCESCPKKEHCDEIAMLYEFSEHHINE
jgi:N-acetylglutamate synthase-like GNAT family acetyltransferase